MSKFKAVLIAAAVLGLAGSALAQTAANLDSKALGLLTPDQIQWPAAQPGKAQSVVVTGDPTKPGSLYVIMMKLPPHVTSRPHSHPGDRFVTVLSGTWWVNTGPKYTPETMVPLKPGSFVTHHAEGIHYDGTKDEPAIIQIIGIGPSGMTPREEK